MQSIEKTEDYYALSSLQPEPLPTSRQDYSQWLEQDMSKVEGFWRQLLKGFTAPTPLVVDQSLRTGFDQEEILGQEIRLSVTSTSQLQSLAKQHQLTLNTLLQGAWALLLSRYSGEGDVVFGVTRACRRSSIVGADSLSLVGLLNTLPLRVSVSPQMQLLPWLKELRAAWIAMRDYEHTPLVEIQGWSDIPDGMPLFNSIVIFKNYLLNSALRSQGGRWENLETQLEQTNYPLTLVGCVEPELILQLKYDRRRFDDATIARMLGHIKTLLESMATHPWQCLADLPLLTQQERYQLLVEWNDTQVDYPQHKCIHQLFEAQVERNPDAIAVVFEDKHLTYRQLNQQANQLAHHLKALGVRPGMLVAVYMNRSLEMIPALLGILKAGGAYVPLVTSYPEARIQWILSSLRIFCIITQSSQLPTICNLQQLPALKDVISLDLPPSHDLIVQKLAFPKQLWTPVHLSQQPLSDLSVSSNPNDTAYIIFTSGSTGTPKGVMVRHKPVINLIDWVNRTFNVNSSDRVLFTTSLCFDLSVYDIFGLLAAGGSIQVMPDCDLRNPERLLQILGDEPITFWDSAPATLQQLVPFFSSTKPSQINSLLRLVFLSGDWIPVKLPDLVRTTFPGVEVISLGGATEATVWSNYYPIQEVHPRWLSIPYGKPIQNVQYYILDSQLNPCPIGIPGNLYIGGECLSSGYINAPVLTAEKFIPNPFSGESDCLYNTGDLARYLPDGNIEFLGRLDHQVKLRGFRIELSEIDTVLGQHPAVRETLVLAREDVPGEKRLVAYVVPETEKAPTTSELRRFLKENLPEYMVPSAFVMLETLPLNTNGKVDRRALPAPRPARPTLEEAFVATRNAMEFQLTQIWEQVLSIQPIGVRDNFFELGGNSLLAVRLFAQIEAICGNKLPLATLLQAPTVEQLTWALQEEGANAPWRSLVAIQPKGDKPPFFCVHAVGGNVLCYYKLASYLGKEQPFYGLQAQGLDGKQTPHSQIEEMAADYIKEIQTLQPQGPYFLGGHSFGGLVAYEMAQQLHAQGQKVALLVLSDTVTPKLYIGDTPPLKYQLSIHRLNLSRLKLKDQLIYVLKRMQWSSERLLKKMIDKFNWWRGHPSSSENPYQLIEELNRHALINYQPQVYPGRMVLIRAIERSTSSYYEPLLGWGELVALGVEVIEVPGHHATMISEPHVRVLATRLGDCLNKAQADN